MEDRKKSKGKRPVSLKWRLVSIMLACWVLPVLLILSVMGAYSYAQVKQQIADTITGSAKNAGNMTGAGLQMALNDSRAASYDPTIRSAYTAYLENGEEVPLYDSVTGYLTRQYRYNDNFITTMLFFCSKPEQVYYISNNAKPGGYTNMREYMSTMHEAVQALSREIGTNIRFVSRGNTLYMVRNMMDNSFVPYAVLVMQVDKDFLFRELSGIVWLTGATVSIDGASVDVYGEGAKPPAQGRTVNGMEYAEHGGPVSLRFQQRVEQHDIVYTLQVDSSPLLDKFSTMQQMLLPVILGVLPLLVFAMLSFYRHVSRPVSQLVDAAAIIEKGDLGYQIPDVPTSVEFRYVFERFNSMSASMKEQFERSYNEQLALQDSRMKALQSQINPHFLNNTLEIINWEARMGGNLKVSRMIEALSTLLNAATARGGNPMTHLSEELAFVDAYLYIISVRMGKRLAVAKEIDETLLPLLVPRLIMQPVVENAVEHGITPRQRGTLTLRVYAREQLLYLEVENDGAMSDADKLAVERLLQKDSEETAKPAQVGIRNVAQRLRLLYGEDASLTITDTQEGGTLSRIVLPLN